MILPSTGTIISQQQLLSLLGITLLAYGAYRFFTFGSRDKRLPPGPPTVPILGNLTVFPRSFLHYKFSEWGESRTSFLFILKLTLFCLQRRNMAIFSPSRSWIRL